MFAAAFDSNGGVFEPLCNENDAIILCSLNHAAIIDVVRFCKSAPYRDENSNMEDLEQQLIKANKAGSRFKLIGTDSVSLWTVVRHRQTKFVIWPISMMPWLWSMNVSAAGFIGATEKGTLEVKGGKGKVGIIIGTFGKSLGGAIGVTPQPKKKSSHRCASVSDHTCFRIH